MAIGLHLDASVLVSLFVEDALTGRVEDVLRGVRLVPIVSDFAAAEFASSLARKVREEQLSVEEAQRAFAAFDIWVARSADQAETTTRHIVAASGFIRRLALPLRAPDAIHIAIADRIGAELATFDIRMADSARSLGLSVAAA